MARFYLKAVGKGNTPKTVTGEKKTGLKAHISGWDIGVLITMTVDTSKDEDVIMVELTGGSNNPEVIKYIGAFSLSNLKKESK